MRNVILETCSRVDDDASYKRVSIGWSIGNGYQTGVKKQLSINNRQWPRSHQIWNDNASIGD